MSEGQLGDYDIAEIRTCIDAYATYLVNASWDPWLDLFTEDAVFLPPGLPMLQGQVEIGNFVKGLPSISCFKANPLDITGYGDIAVSRGEYSQRFTDSDGIEVSEQGKFIWIWAKEPNGSWKIKQDIWNADA